MPGSRLLLLLAALIVALAAYALCRIEATNPRVTGDSELILPLNVRNPAAFVMGPGAYR